MSTTTHKVGAVLTMIVAALILAAVSANAAVAGVTTQTKAPSIADIDW